MLRASIPVSLIGCGPAPPSCVALVRSGLLASLVGGAPCIVVSVIYTPFVEGTAAGVFSPVVQALVEGEAARAVASELQASLVGSGD